MISPADGTVIDIRDRKICIFMFLQNVHVNRAPISGKIREITYKKGGYLPAFCKDSERNERNEFIIHSKYGDVSVTQIAGTIARRIVSYSRVNDFIEQGQRIGMIRFGSRVDVTIPHDFEIVVREGERVLAGKTVIAIVKKMTGNLNMNVFQMLRLPDLVTLLNLICGISSIAVAAKATVQAATFQTAAAHDGLPWL